MNRLNQNDYFATKFSFFRFCFCEKLDFGWKLWTFCLEWLKNSWKKYWVLDLQSESINTFSNTSSQNVLNIQYQYFLRVLNTQYVFNTNSLSLTKFILPDTLIPFINTPWRLYGPSWLEEVLGEILLSK